MAYQGEESKHCALIEKSKAQVAQATLKYQRGKGSLDAVNEANTRLAAAQYFSYEHSAGVIPDDR